jgi:hypothetical protein
MKLFNIEKIRKRILSALFGWSLILPSKDGPEKPFEGKITSAESDEESWDDPLDISDESILRQTDPLLMTKKERHESTIRYWMERKGYSREEIEKPLTDKRLEELGRGSWSNYKDLDRRVKEKLIKEGGLVAQAILLEKPSHLEEGIITLDN